jgi:hypothetical protein
MDLPVSDLLIIFTVLGCVASVVWALWMLRRERLL